MNINIRILAKSFGITQESAELWLPPINKAGTLAELTSVLRWGLYLAEIGHESSGLTRLVESLDYSPEGLMKTWPSRFNKTLANRLGRTKEHPADQSGIANEAYGDRMGNRPGTNDGSRFIGRGPLQITGRDNYIACKKYLKLLGVDADLENDPALLIVDREVAAVSTVWFWDTRHLNTFADSADIVGATKAINGGVIGLEDRKSRYMKAINLLKEL